MLGTLHYINETTKTMAAHLRAFQLRVLDGIEAFTECLLRLATSNNISTVVVATDMPNFEEVSMGLIDLAGSTSHAEASTQFQPGIS